MLGNRSSKGFLFLTPLRGEALERRGIHQAIQLIDIESLNTSLQTIQRCRQAGDCGLACSDLMAPAFLNGT